jgi:hypothetical protein
MHPAWGIIQQHLTANAEAYLALASAIVIASVCTMPENPPATFRDLWAWLRNTLQTAVPAARARNEAHSSSSVSTPTTSSTQEATASTAVDPTQPKTGA